MLILRRKEGQWLEIRHRSGDLIRVRACNIRSRFPGQLDLVFDDPERHFEIHRPERGERGAATVPEVDPLGARATSLDVSAAVELAGVVQAPLGA